MKGKILKAEHIDNKYIVQKQTKYGTFTASVTPHPSDFDIENDFDGFLFAEMKCDLMAYKRKAKNMKERAIGAEHLYITLCNTNISDEALMQIKKQVDNIWEEYYNTNETYHILKTSYKPLTERMLNSRRVFRKKINKD